jgi:diadenosine tetraphosphate (Ap4A) HIT family hydrolase
MQQSWLPVKPQWSMLLLSYWRGQIEMIKEVPIDDPNYDSGCVFCRMKLDEELSSDPANEILFCGRHHYVMAGLGAWTPGYVLLITGRHIDNFSVAPDSYQSECLALFRNIEQLFLAKFGQLTVFEHGELGGQSRAGGCINHAHIHFLAKNLNLCRDLQERFRPIDLSREDDPWRHLPRLQSPYLYVKEFGQEHKAFVVDRPLPTQFLRQEIARKIEMADHWDYRLYPFFENVIQTIAIFKGRISI